MTDVDQARALLAKAADADLTVDQAIAAAAVHVQLALVQPVDQDAVDELIAIDVALNDAAVPIADTIVQRVEHLIEQWRALLESQQPY